MNMVTIFNRILVESKNFKGEMLLLKNTEKAPNMGSRFGQDVEPSGFYAIEYHDYQKSALDNSIYKLYKVNIKKPLIINVDTDTLISWKRDLSDQYKAKGKRLSNKLIQDGYDVIITWNTTYNETGEIIVMDTSTLREVDLNDV